MTGHGGNIYEFAGASGFSERDIIDFSASINPLGLPESVKAAIKRSMRQLCNYPDPDAGRLRSKIAEHLCISTESVVCGNGSTELIYLIARALRPERILIPQPTFSEYERACKVSNKLQVASYKLRHQNNFDIDPDKFIEAMEKMVNSALCTLYEPLAPYGSCPTGHRPSHRPHSAFPCMAFLCNPNNPTGRLIRKDDVLKIADAARELKCYLVVDEAFIDFVPGDSVCRAVEENTHLIVLRSMTKIFAISGLRVGYGVFPSNILSLINKYKEPWTVNTMAQEAGIAALDDKGYIKKTFSFIKREKRFIENKFKELGIDFLPSAANYYLIRVNNADRLIKSLQSKGIMVRDCSNFNRLGRSYIRAAVKRRGENMRLLRELSNICTE